MEFMRHCGRMRNERVNRADGEYFFLSFWKIIPGSWNMI